MADDANTGLLLTLEARTAAFEKALVRVEKNTAKTFNTVKDSANRSVAQFEQTMARTAKFEAAFSRMDRGFANFGRSLLPSLGAISAALSAREVLAYADAWTSAKNSLAVAGVTGERQAKILDQLYQSAQANATPLSAMADLYGKAAQASDNLGASQQDLLKFSDGVAVALRVAGSSAGQASGALTQLGQLLGSARVQAEEFNSVNDGARPILIAVANGLDKAGGSVNKLKQLVNDGEVSGRQFFEAFLKGLPSIQSMAANATQTIDQGVTKVSNAFLKYIGQTDESLGASQRLVQGLNALADNFDQTADVTLQLASVLAGALVGRSIAGMLSAIPQAASAVVALVTAMRAGTLTAAGFTAALGPIGLIAGAATAAYLAFNNWEGAIDDATRALADQAGSGAAIEGMIADVAKAQKAYQDAIANTANTQTEASKSIVADTLKEFNAKRSLLELELKRQRALIAVQQAELGQKGAALKAEVGSSVFTRNSAVERGYGDANRDYVRLPDDITGLEKTQAVIDASPITAEIQKIRAEMSLTEISAGKLEEALNTTFGDSEGGGGVKPSDSGSGSGKGKGGKGSRLDEYERLSKRIAEATAATIAETQAQEALNPTVEDYGYAVLKARTEHELLNAAMEAGRTITPELRKEIESTAEAYAKTEANAARLHDTQDALRQSAEEWAGTAKDATKGFIDDLRNGKSAAEALGNVLDRVTDKLIDMALDGLFSVGKTGGGGGAGGEIFSLNLWSETA
ncbi:tape measure protein [Rhizobium puerariae]|uniref:Tape measure protein n=1 Tax=Rhizobium puerariae TaxID=1585791 RepID=A0ABV6ANI4_9HYPH